MKHEDKLDYLKMGEVLADWEWSQEDWNQMAKFYRSEFWELSKVIILVPIIIFVAIWEYRNEINKGPSFRHSPMIGTILLLLYCLISFFVWLNRFITPRPRKNTLPKIIIGKSGILVGDSFISWKKKFKLSDVSLDAESTNQSWIKLVLAWYFGTVKINIPVPNNKLSDAQTVVSVLSKEKSKIKAGTTQEDLEEFKKSLR